MKPKRDIISTDRDILQQNKGFGRRIRTENVETEVSSHLFAAWLINHQ